MLSPHHFTGESSATQTYGKFVTVAVSDPEFSRWMQGFAPEGLRSIPVESFGVHTSRERITFRLVPLREIQRPRWPIVFARLTRMELLPLLMAPAALAIAVVAEQGALDLAAALLTLLSLWLLHAAAFSLNDYSDHFSGLDRVQSRRGSQVIQRGWLAAFQVRRLAHLFLAGGVLVGAALAILKPMVVLPLGLVAVLAILGFSQGGRGFKAHGLGEIIVFFCFGPLLTLGMTEVSRAEPLFEWSNLLPGVGFGYLATLIFQLRTFESIAAEKQIRTGALVARLGFDRAKRWLGAMLFFAPVICGLSLWPWLGGWASASLAAMLVMLLSVPLRRLWRAASPLASHVVGLASEVRRIHLYWSLAALLMALVLPRTTLWFR